MLFFSLLSAVLLCAEWQRVEGLGWGDIKDKVEDTYEDVKDTGEGIINDVAEIAEEFVDSVAGQVASVATAVTGAAEAASTYLDKISASASKVMTTIQSVAYVAADAIETAVSGFEETTWAKLIDAAKYVIYTLPSEIQDLVKDGLNYLDQLLEFDAAPFPFDVIEKRDVKSFVKCMKPDVMDYMKEWAQDVGSLFVELGGDLDITPVFNRELIDDAMTKSEECLREVALEIWERERDYIADTILDAAYAWLEFDDLAVSVEISFTACTMVCGSASVGLAVSATQPLAGTYWSASSGVDLSATVGGTLSGTINFFPSFDGIAGDPDPSTSHVIGLDILNIPLFPDFIPEVGVSIDDSGDFAGFGITSDIIDLSLDLNGAFGISYNYAASYWLITTKDIMDDYFGISTRRRLGRSYDDESKEEKKKRKSFEKNLKELESGGYLVTKTVDTGVYEANNPVTLTCPTDEPYGSYDTIATDVMGLGHIEVIDVIYGNLQGDNSCSHDDAFDTVHEACSYLGQCTFNADQKTLGDNPCEDGVQVSVSVIYTCRGAKSVYNIGCFRTNFQDIIKHKWYHDYRDDILQDDWEQRENSMGKCSAIAQKKKYDGFASYLHGQCVAFKKLLKDGHYNRYNEERTAECPADGQGDVDDWNVFVFVQDDLALEDLGCHNATELHAADISMDLLEETHFLLQDDYQNRTNAIMKCAQVANEKKKYKGFALHDGGACYASKKLRRREMEKRGIDLNHTHDCYGSRGTGKSMNVYMFPYVKKKNDDKEELTKGEIAMIVVLPFVFVLLVGFAAFYYLTRVKGYKNPVPCPKCCDKCCAPLKECKACESCSELCKKCTLGCECKCCKRGAVPTKQRKELVPDGKGGFKMAVTKG